jgi:hypothetical protein
MVTLQRAFARASVRARAAGSASRLGSHGRRALATQAMTAEEVRGAARGPCACLEALVAPRRGVLLDLLPVRHHQRPSFSCTALIRTRAPQMERKYLVPTYNADGVRGKEGVVFVRGA